MRASSIRKTVLLPRRRRKDIYHALHFLFFTMKPTPQQELYIEYMQGNGPAPEGWHANGLQRKDVRDYWGETPDHPVEKEDSAEQMVDQAIRLRIEAMAAYYMQLANGGLKPRVIRHKNHERFHVPLSQADALRFATLQLELEHSGLSGSAAVEHTALRAKYAPLFLYALKPEDADKWHMGE
jgi:hypothetical protein